MVITSFLFDYQNIIKEYHAKCEQQHMNITKSCYGNITGNKSNSIAHNSKAINNSQSSYIINVSLMNSYIMDSCIIQTY